jgi:hypothetical protein
MLAAPTVRGYSGDVLKPGMIDCNFYVPVYPRRCV